jgi:nucleoside-diphosphate-sugar epimerase
MILVTGASGFVGNALCAALSEAHIPFRGASRTLISNPGSDFNFNLWSVGELNKNTNWCRALVDATCVIHCASKVHSMGGESQNNLSEYRVVNVDGTRRLAEQAVAAGVKRFIYISSIKVNGERTECDAPFSVRDSPSPKDAYSLSKYEAEEALFKISSETGLEVVVIRPPLIYGPRVKGNLARLLMLIRRRIPLPLGALRNRRSFVGIDNLLDLTIRCVDHPSASGQVFLVSDGDDLTVATFAKYIADAMQCPSRFFDVPPSLLRLAGKILGRQAEIDRFVGTLQIDISETRKILEWTPMLCVKEGIRRMVKTV